MRRSIIMTAGGTAAVGLMLVAMYSWFHAGEWALSAEQPEAMRWAARCAAIAAAAAAQIIAITFVIGRMYQNRSAHDGLRLTAGLVCCIALVSAAALGLAARG